jgi:hypothetical protein
MRWTHRDGVYYTSNQNLILRNFLAGMAMQCIRDLDINTGKEENPCCPRESLNVINRTLDTNPSLEPVENKTVSPETRACAKAAMSLYHEPDQETVYATTKSLNLCLDLFIHKHSDRHSAVSNINKDRPLFYTTSGRLGLGPPELKAGDHICILFGGNSLYVLRPIPSSENFYFIGECYVHGLMRGEAMVSFENKKVTSQTFHLR